MDTSKRVIARELSSHLPQSIVGILSLAGAGTYFAIVFAPHVPREPLIGWSGLLAFTLSVWAGASIYWRLVPHDDQEYLKSWQDLSIVGAVVCNALIGASVWLFMPAAPPELVDAQVIFYAWYIMTFALVNNEGVAHARWTLWLVTGSLAAYLFIHPPHGGLAVGVVVVLMGVAASMLQQFIRRSVIKATTAQLEAEAAQRDLAIALAEVSAQRDARARFMASVSHDLQQPLQAAQMLFELGCERAEPDIIEDGRTAFGSVGRLLEQMLDFMRLSSGVKHPAGNVVVTVDDALEPLRSRYRLRDMGGTKLKWVGSSALIRVELDQFHRTVGNLIDNAIRHAGARRIVVGASRRGTTIAIRVLDDGQGIPAELRATLFEPYVRGARTDGSDEGFGLGLASAKVLSETMGGSLSLDPGEYRGTRFRLELPLLADEPQADRCIAA